MPEKRRDSELITHLRPIVATLRRLVGWAESHRSPVLIVVGAVSGIASAVYFASHALDPFPLLTPRISDIEQTIAAMKEGAPPIFALDPGPAHPGFYKPGVDAPGELFFYPIAGRILGIDNAQELVRLSFIACFAAAAAVVPWLYGTLLRSVLAGLVAPLVLGYGVLEKVSIVQVDMYWIPGVLLVVGAPVLMLALTRWDWNRRTMLLIAGLLVIVSFGNSIRPQVGLPVLVGALAVVLAREPRWRRRGLVGICFLLAYVSISTGAMKLATEYRDAKVDGSQKFAVRGGKTIGGAGVSGPWHQVYIGLAFLRNDHGVDQFLDDEANAYVTKAAPGTTYLSKRYADVLRDRVLEIAKDDPAFVIETVAAKFGAISSLSVERWRFLVVLVPLMLLLGTIRREMRRWFALLALMAFVGVLPVLVSWPADTYSVPFAAAFLVATLMAAGWIAAHLETGAVWLLDDVERGDWEASPERTGSAKALDRARAGIEENDLRRRGVVLVAVIALTVGGSVLLSAISAGARDTVYYNSAVNYMVPELPPPGELVGSADFSAGLPEGWLVSGKAKVRADREGIRVRIGKRGLVASPGVPVKPGTYVVVARGTIPDGGVYVGAADANSPNILAQQVYWSDETLDGPIDLGVEVKLATGGFIRFALTNWSRRDDPSTVLLKDMRIYRVDDSGKSPADPTADDGASKPHGGGDENDGLHWPRRDGLKWPHFASVVVLG